MKNLLWTIALNCETHKNDMKEQKNKTVYSRASAKSCSQSHFVSPARFKRHTSCITRAGKSGPRYDTSARWTKHEREREREWNHVKASDRSLPVASIFARGPAFRAKRLLRGKTKSKKSDCLGRKKGRQVIRGQTESRCMDAGTFVVAIESPLRTYSSCALIITKKTLQTN